MSAAAVIAPTTNTNAAPAPAAMAGAAAVVSSGPDAGELQNQYRDYYSRIFPVKKICEWLSHGNDSTYLFNREICFTLPGDVFCRFKSFPDAAKLTQALVSQAPEKIDAGAVYQIPAEKRHQTPLVAQERELVFDIDMSDYDSVRSCCKGKKICRNCWPWMSTAAHIIKYMVNECFGYTRLMPVFSGRRGIHIWVCDEAARKLSDDERGAIVHFMTVVHGAQFRVNCAYELQRNSLAPALETVVAKHIEEAFLNIFMNRNNANCIFTNAASADVFRLAAEKINQQVPIGNSSAQSERVWQALSGTPGQPMDEQQFRWAVVNLPPGFVKGIELVLLYPRLDEHVSTHRDHLLKLPLCVHPGTQRLCCPLRFEDLHNFDPVAHPPTLSQMLESGSIAEKWLAPLDAVITKAPVRAAANPAVAAAPK
jgi:DNA primase small subunit